MLQPTRSGQSPTRPRASTSTPVLPVSRLSASERTNRVLGLMDEYARLGGGPESRKKREMKMADILEASGVSRSKVEEALSLRGKGAIKGSRIMVESWFTTAIQ